MNGLLRVLDKNHTFGGLDFLWKPAKIYAQFLKVCFDTWFSLRKETA